MNISETTFLSNTIQQWLIAVGAMAVFLAVLLALKAIVFKKLIVLAQRTKTRVDDLIARLLHDVKFITILAISVYAGSLFLILPEKIVSILKVTVILLLLLQLALWSNSAIKYWIDNLKKRKMEEDAAQATALGAIGFVSKLVLWTVVLLLALDNLGIDVTGLIAGLGITGIAVALALQNILGDLFASLSIVLDKPFVIGDFIIVDNFLGTVEYVGLKTTRLRSLYGEQLIFSNSDLLKSRIRNYKRMYERRVVFAFGVTYETPLEKVEKIPQMVKDIISNLENVRFDRAHFKEFGDFSLNYEVVYYVLLPDYAVYMDLQQNINLNLMKQFQEEGIDFAYPTQTLFIKKQEG